MKCENCLHYEACKSMVSVIERATMYSIAMRVCNNFADKDLYIKLPCKVGDTVWVIYRGYITTAKVLAIYIDRVGGMFDLKIKTKEETTVGFRTVIDKDYTFDDVFLTREDAEKKLEELKNECK